MMGEVDILDDNITSVMNVRIQYLMSGYNINQMIAVVG